MAAIHYRFSYAEISPDEFQALSNKIDAWAFNGIFLNPKLKIADFYLDEKDNPDIFNIPACCQLTVIQ